MGIYITPTLYAGEDPPKTEFPYQRAHTVDEAVLIIENGIAGLWSGRNYVKAWVPDDDDFIRAVLLRVGASEAWAENRIGYARTGVVPPLTASV